MPVAGVGPDATGRSLTSFGPGRGEVAGSDLTAGRVTERDLAWGCGGRRTLGLAVTCVYLLLSTALKLLLSLLNVWIHKVFETAESG